MARRRAESDNPVSLFPFLSILACVIGTLIFLSSSLALSQIESEPEEELLQRVEELKQLKARKQEMEHTLEELTPMLEDLEKYREALRKLQAEAEKLRKKLAEREDPEARKRLEELLQRQKELQELIEQRRREIAALREKLEELRRDIEQRRRVLSAPTVVVMPSENSGRQPGRGTESVFVEADGEGLILDPDGEKTRVTKSQLKKDGEFLKIIDYVADKEDRVLVFLLRNDGIETYRTAERFARHRGAVVAKLPLIGDGMLDLSRL